MSELSQNLSEKSVHKIYNYEEKKKIVYKIQKIKSKKDYFKLYNLLCINNVKFSRNNNGIFFNINKLSDFFLNEIELFLDKINEKYSLIEDSENSNEDSDNLISNEEVEEVNSLILNNNNINKIQIKKKILIQ